ncbi:MAG: Fic family protein [Rhodospirillales bacterium]|nr:Fic family protein [Rhodospirillales bacterium]
MYIWQDDDWPKFTWDAEALLAPLAEARHKQGRLLGLMQRLGFDLQIEASFQATVEDVIRTSEIEGEKLDPASVRSSVARRLGLPDAGLPSSDARAEGVVEMMMDAMQNHAGQLTDRRLFAWHAALFPTGHSGMRKIVTGDWRDDRDGPMQVVSGPLGRQKVHYEAPPAKRLKAEMKRFLTWFNGSDTTVGSADRIFNRPAIGGMDGLLRSGIAHLWFVTIHPFEDGNGRIARAIADLALARTEGTGKRFYSVSAQIQRERSRYYDVLERTQKGSLDVTAWLVWFMSCFSHAVDVAEEKSQSVLRKAEFWLRFSEEPLSVRQKTILNRFMDSFEGNLTARKWAAIGKCSVDTASRDINDLLERGLLVRNPGGSKRTSFSAAGFETGAPSDD